jgi:GTPase SAR1 family protein
VTCILLFIKKKNFSQTRGAFRKSVFTVHCTTFLMCNRYQGREFFSFHLKTCIYTLLIFTISPFLMVAKVFLNLGFAGSGKTTFSSSFRKDSRCYYVNLDPAVHDTIFKPNMDIRDTIDYKNVMASYKLGPNGAITTCLNIFSTKLDQFYNVLYKKQYEYDYIIIDVPGQIELFAWSPSGKLIVETLSKLQDFNINYIIDSQKCMQSKTFISNILYMSTILFQFGGVNTSIVFNKADSIEIKSRIQLLIHDVDWINSENQDAFQDLMDDIKFTFDDIFKRVSYQFWSSIDTNWVVTGVEKLEI